MKTTGTLKPLRKMMSHDLISAIEREVRSWPGVSAGLHRFGGIEFRVGRREIGHLHRHGLADLPFPTKTREQLVRDGRAEPHHILPDSGWVSHAVRNDADVLEVIELFRMNYAR